MCIIYSTYTLILHLPYLHSTIATEMFLICVQNYMTTHELAKALGCLCSTPTKYLILRLKWLVENTKSGGPWDRLTVEPLVASFLNC